MYNIELTENELHNLAAFLERTELKGSEVQFYVAIMQKLHTANVVTDDTEKKD